MKNNEIKVDGIMLVQQNYLEKKMAEAERKAIMKRNRKAKRYSKKCARERIGKRIEKAIAILGIASFITALSVAGCSAMGNPRYAIPVNNGNGIHYEYVTELECTVTEVTDTLVTVLYNGNLYDFFGYGYEVGEQIIRQFTDNWEIVGVVEE